MMGVSRSGYYKWLRREPSSREINREFMVGVVEDIHSEHPTHGYRWVAAYIRINLQLSISDNFSYKCFQYLGIQSQTRHKIHYKPRKVKDKYPNLIYSTWDTVDRPRQVIVSDMTVIKYSWFFFELTMYFDVFTKEILTWHVAERRGHRDQYIDGLNDVINLLKGTDEPTVLHTDQGSVYASLAYNELIKDTLIVRSMSRAGKPTDNPVNESLNGWIKEELFIDFKIETCNSREEFEEALDAYVDYYNEKRPCYAIGYDTPNNYRKRFYKGELPRKDTFGKREANATPDAIDPAIMCVFTKRIMRAATFLLFVLFGVAGMFFLLDYTYLGAAQISVYAGGITMLYVFAIQLVSKRTLQGLLEHVKGSKIVGRALVCLVGFVTLAVIVLKNHFIDMAATVADTEVPMDQVGSALVGADKYGYVLPFEFISVFLLACIIGGILIARKEDKK